MVEAALTLPTIVTSELVTGVLDEMIGILPVVIPAAIGWIGIRKGISFLLGMLRRA